MKQTERYAVFLNWEKSMLWKWLYYPKQSADSIHPYQTNNDMFKELGLIILQFIWGEKRPRRAKAILERKVELDESTFWLQTILPRHYGTDTKAETESKGTRHKAERWTHTPIGIFSLTREARSYNGERTEKRASSVSGAGKLDNYM